MAIEDEKKSAEDESLNDDNFWGDAGRSAGEGALAGAVLALVTFLLSSWLGGHDE